MNDLEMCRTFEIFGEMLPVWDKLRDFYPVLCFFYVCENLRKENVNVIFFFGWSCELYGVDFVRYILTCNFCC